MANETIQRRQFMALASALALAGCGNLIGPGDAPQLYTLHPAMPGAAQAPAASWSLAVAMPDASESLDSQRIALTRSGTTMDYYANAAWPGSLTAVVQAALVGAFQDSGRVQAVAREDDALHADYLLLTEIRDFTAHYSDPDGAPTVTVTIAAQMATAHGRKVVAHLTATQQAQASVNSVDAAVQAFDSAFGAVLAQIVAWAVALPPPPPPGLSTR